MRLTGVSLSVSLSWAQRSGFSLREGGHALTAFSRVWGPAHSHFLSGCGAVAWSARRLWASSRPPGGRSGQVAGRQRLCELAGGVRSPPRRPPPLKVPVPAPGQPQFTQPFPPTPDTHTHTPAHTHIQEVDSMEWVVIPLLLKSERGRCGY